MKKIIILGYSVRDYNIELYLKLKNKLNLKFVFSHLEPWIFERYPNVRKLNITQRQDFNFCYASGFAPSILKDLLKKDYDIIISTASFAFHTHLSFLIAKLLRRKFICWDETWNYPRIFATRILRPYIRFIIRHSDACMVAGTKAKEFHLKNGANPKTVFIVPDAAEDLSSFKVKKSDNMELRKKHDIPEGKKIILYLSRIAKYKGLDYLIRAFSKLEKESDNVFLLIGGDADSNLYSSSAAEGNFKLYCQKLAKSLNIKNIKFIGHVSHEDIVKYFYLCNIFVLPTRFLWDDVIPCEAWGLIINEVMSVGKPVISTNAVAAAYDLIRNGKNGSVNYTKY